MVLDGEQCDSEHEVRVRSVWGPDRVLGSVSAHFSHLL